MTSTSIVSALQTFLKALTWTSTDGSGTTKFADVFTYENSLFMGGYPYAYIDDSGMTSTTLDNRSWDCDLTINIWVVVNWSLIDKSDDDARREEGALRIREATDVLSKKLYELSLQTTLGVCYLSSPSYGGIQAEGDLNLLRRQLTITTKYEIDR